MATIADILKAKYSNKTLSEFKDIENSPITNIDPMRERRQRRMENEEMVSDQKNDERFEKFKQSLRKGYEERQRAKEPAKEPERPKVVYMKPDRVKEETPQTEKKEDLTAVVKIGKPDGMVMRRARSLEELDRQKAGEVKESSQDMYKSLESEARKIGKDWDNFRNEKYTLPKDLEDQSKNIGKSFDKFKNEKYNMPESLNEDLKKILRKVK